MAGWACWTIIRIFSAVLTARWDTVSCLTVSALWIVEDKWIPVIRFKPPESICIILSIAFPSPPFLNRPFIAIRLIQPILQANEGLAQSRQSEQGLIIARSLRYSAQVWCLCPLVSDPSLRDFHAECVIAARCSRLNRNAYAWMKRPQHNQ